MNTDNHRVTGTSTLGTTTHSRCLRAVLL
jgi:hypothetical protein